MVHPGLFVADIPGTPKTSINLQLINLPPPVLLPSTIPLTSAPSSTWSPPPLLSGKYSKKRSRPASPTPSDPLVLHPPSASIPLSSVLSAPLTLQSLHHDGSDIFPASPSSAATTPHPSASALSALGSDLLTNACAYAACPTPRTARPLRAASASYRATVKTALHVSSSLGSAMDFSLRLEEVGDGNSEKLVESLLRAVPTDVFASKILSLFAVARSKSSEDCYSPGVAEAVSATVDGLDRAAYASFWRGVGEGIDALCRAEGDADACKATLQRLQDEVGRIFYRVSP